MIQKRINPPPVDTKGWILNNIKKTEETREDLKKSNDLVLSTTLTGWIDKIGEKITQDEMSKMGDESELPIRIVELARDKDISVYKYPEKETSSERASTRIWETKESVDFEAVGLKVAKSDTDLQGFKPIKGSGKVGTALATIKMVAKAYGTPCQIDAIERSLESGISRTGSIPMQGVGQLIESMGLQTQIGIVEISNLKRLELPVILKLNSNYCLLTEVNNSGLLLADPEMGWSRLEYEEAIEKLGSKINVLLIKRLSDTPTKTFGWNWFTPVIKRFKWSLIQVLLASIFIQVFQLVNPLLIQQIIDKVISQSNLSALQVLGGALIVSALFQGLLTAVRTWLLIDTTDRMDLLLGSQVIDKLLRLPLRFFEKRQVGELSQRLSELGNLRGFLTGTAITSLLDLMFATIYILIMIMYSPLLTAVALGTIPVYILMILFIAPVYRRLIRNQARYMAKTQSHLIETLSGIQTVKAQHFELNSRWKWQEIFWPNSRRFQKCCAGQ